MATIAGAELGREDKVLMWQGKKWANSWGYCEYS